MGRIKKDKTLRPVFPNAGIRAAYRKKLLALIDEMTASYEHWISAAYRAVPPAAGIDIGMDGILWLGFSLDVEGGHDAEYPAQAQDESYRKKRKRREALASKELEKELKRLGKHWENRFDDAALRMAGWFAKATHNRSSAALKHILRKGGWTVEFKMTQPVRDVLNATVAENVSLIKSIPSQFHTQVEGMVMRSVAAGRDLAPLTRELQKQFGVTRRRAEFIARDQNNKATSQITRARYVDMGIEEAIWLHSGGGKKKRPTHVANSGKKFDVAQGWFDPDPKVRAYIQPGYLVNCRCVCKPVVKGFT